MNQLPFSVYDFFGYLAGAVVLAAFIASFFGDASFQASPTLPVGFLLVIVVYVLGHMSKRRRRPDRTTHRSEAVRDARPCPPRNRTPGKSEARFFPGYFRALPPRVQAQVRVRVGDREGEDLFLHCHARMKSDSVVQGVAQHLPEPLRLPPKYGHGYFARRGMSSRRHRPRQRQDPDRLRTRAGGYFLRAGPAGLFYRYLKFYRQYGFELFTSYAETDLQ